MRGVVMHVFLQIVAFYLQTDWSSRPVFTKGKRPRIVFILGLFQYFAQKE